MTELNLKVMKKIGQVKNVEELFLLAKEYNFVVTEEQAIEHMKNLKEKIGEISDKELENVSGGAGKNGFSFYPPMDITLG